MSFNVGDRVRLNDPWTPELMGVEGTIERFNEATDEWVVTIEPTAEVIELFNSFPENADNGATPSEVFFYGDELEAA